MSHRLLAALAGLAILLMAAPPAGAAQALGCDLSVSPAQTEPAEPVSGEFRQTIHLVNDGSQTCDVTFSVLQMLQDLDGTPRYAASQAISSSFSIDKATASIAPGHKDQVNLAGAIPAGAHSAYLAVLSTYSSVGQQAGSSVAIRTQIASQYLLRGPKPWIETTKVTDVGFMPDSGSRKQVYATVMNTGNVHVRPTGTVDVIENGRRVATVTLEADREPPPAILPGWSRRLVGNWTPTGPVGNSVRLQATVTGAGTTTKFARSVSFTANGHPLVKAASLLLNATVRDKPVVTAIVRNTGNEVLHAALVTIVAKQDNKFERARQTYTLPPLPPDGTHTITWTQDLPKGAYIVDAKVEDQSQLLDEKSAGFEIGNAIANGVRKSRSLLLYLAIGLVVLAASGSVLGLRQAGWLRAAVSR